MTQEEVKAIRWVERILPPLLIASIIALATCAIQTQEAVAQLQAGQKTEKETHSQTDSDISEIRANQDRLLRQQHSIEVNVQRIDTRQEHFKEEVGELKQQNNEIIRLLTNNGHNNQ